MKLSMSRSHFMSRSNAGGFSLIEVLVTLLVLVIGLLGVVGMQLLSVQNNQGAYLRTQATYIASDMLDRIRANKVGQDTDSYTGFDSASTPDDSAGGCATSAAGCSAAQLANLDVREIASNVVDVYDLGVAYQPILPSGSVAVTKVAGATSGDPVEYVVRVNWQERDFDGDDGDTVRVDNVGRFVELRTFIRDK